MNEEVLDLPEIKEQHYNSRYSFILGLINVGILLVMIFLSYLAFNNIIDKSISDIALPIMFLVLIVLGATGIQYTFKSIRKKESVSFQKVIGIVSNSLVLLLLAAIFMVFITDIHKVFQDS